MVIVPTSLVQEKGCAPAVACIIEGENDVEGMLKEWEWEDDADLPGSVILASGEGEGEGEGVGWALDDELGCPWGEVNGSSSSL